jgi:hypothetical protein
MLRKYLLTSYGGVMSPQVTTSIRIDRIKRETARQADLIIAHTLSQPRSSATGESPAFPSSNNDVSGPVGDDS